MSLTTQATTAPAALEPISDVPLGKIGMAEMLFNPVRFQQVQRVASMLQHSPLVPAHIRGQSKEEGMANIILSFALAVEMGENPLVLMQNVYFVSGKAGWLTSYMIAKAARAGVFRGPIRWKTTGSGKSLSVTAMAELAQSGETVEATADMVMAEAEKWTRSDKYRTMPEHMLKWRSATMLIRLYAPQVMLGYHTADELEDVEAAGPPVPRSKPVESSTSALMQALDVKGEPAEQAKTEAPSKPTRKPKAQDTHYLDEAEQRALALLNQGDQEGWISEGAMGGYTDQIGAQRKASDITALNATIAKLEALRDAVPEREPGSDD